MGRVVGTKAVGDDANSVHREKMILDLFYRLPLSSWSVFLPISIRSLFVSWDCIHPCSVFRLYCVFDAFLTID